MYRRLFFALLLALLSCLVPCVAVAEPSASPEALREQFAKPPVDTRILKMLHSLPDAPEAQDALFDGLLKQGFGGGVTNDSFREGYLENEGEWQAFARGVKAMKSRGMGLWLYDEKGYPSGAAGGITLRDHPEWEAHGLLFAEADAAGGPVTLDMPSGAFVQAAAYRVADGALSLEDPVDLSAQVKDGKLVWDAPQGAWHLVAVTEDRLYENTHAALSLADKLPYINLLMPEPTARFIEVTHGGYAAHLGNDLGAYFAATFTDEPSLMGWWMRKQPFRVLPWAPNLPVEFEQRRGYALAPRLALLVAGTGAEAQRARYDFWQTVGELVAENFFGQIQTWCHKHNTLSGGHLLAEEGILTHVPLYGNFFQCARRLDAPGIDCLTSVPSEVPWYIARLLSSAAELEGRSLTMCETSDFSQCYRPEGDKRPVVEVTEDMIRGTINRLMLNGINTITSYYSFTGLSDEQLNRLNEWTGRCRTLLYGGQQVTDIAVLYPVESIWPNFIPAYQWVSDAPVAARQVEKVYRGAIDQLYAAHRDFTVLDARTLAEAKVKNGALCYGALKWRVLVLPRVDTLPTAAWERVAEFWRAGGIVAALDVLPSNSPTAFPDPRIEALAQEVFGGFSFPKLSNSASGGTGIYLNPGTESMLTRALDTLIENPVALQGSPSPIRCTHRRIADHDVFFLINDSGTAWEGTVDLCGRGEGERWDPATGAAELCASPRDISLKLGPYGGAFYRFSGSEAPKRLPGNAVALPERVVDTPKPDPKLGGGEFVQQELSRDGEGRWRAKGVLSKGDTDTFLFLSFDYPQPVDVHDSEWVKTEVEVPAGQTGATQLLLILRDKNGVEYLANTGIPLDSPGHTTAYLPLSCFQRAGWTQSAGEFDFTAVVTARVGWGGYKGQAGETLVFCTSPPAFLRVGNPGGA